MRLKYVTNECLADLRANIENNLEIYREGEFDLKFVRQAAHEFEGDFSEVDPTKSDAHNAKVIYEALKGIKLVTARSENFWVALTHGPLLDFSRAKWPILTGSQAVTSIETHYFARTNRSIESRNAVSSLYWKGLLASRITAYPLEEALKVICLNSDIQNSVLERPNVVTSNELMTAIVGVFIRSLNTDKVLVTREPFRAFMREMNQLCGSIALEFLPQAKVNQYVGEIAQKVWLDFQDKPDLLMAAE